MSGLLSETVELSVNGRTIAVPKGTTVLSAVAIAGVGMTRFSVTGQPRGPLCGMGICHECRVTINGQAQKRACMIESCAGMKILAGGGS